MVFQRSAVLERCAHSVYVVPDDWRAQEAWKIPASKRIAWFCWICREFGDSRFSVEKLHRLALANCRDTPPREKIRITNEIILNADYDLPRA